MSSFNAVGKKPNANQPPTINDNPPKEKETLKPSVFAHIPPRDKSKSAAAPRLYKFTPRTPREGLSTKEDPMIDMALSPRIEEEPPIIDSGVAMSEINFFHEEEEIRRARSDVPIILESEKTTSDPIEESSVSSGASSNTEVPDKQPTRAIELTDPRIKNLLSVIPKKGALPAPPITREPSQFSELEATRTIESDLGTIRSPRERKVPLLRSDRVLELKERAKVSSLPRTSTRRSALPKLAEISSSAVREGQQFDSTRSEQALSDLTAIIPLTSIYTEHGPDEGSPEYEAREIINLPPLLSENPTGGLTKIKQQPFFGKPRGLPSPRSAFSTTLRRPVMEKKIPDESLDITHSGEEEIKELGPIKAIELVEVHRALAADEYTALLMAEKKTGKIKESGILVKLGTLGRRAALPSARNITLRVTNSIGSMIRELNDPGSASKTMRALNILYYIVSGEIFIDTSSHPEIELLSEYLQPLSPNDKFSCLKQLYKEVEEHLDLVQRLGLQRAFDEMEIVQSRYGNCNFHQIALDLKYRLENQTDDEAETGSETDH